MDMVKQEWRKIAAAIIAGTILVVINILIAPSSDTEVVYYPESPIADSWVFVPVALSIVLVSLTGISVNFVLLQNALPGGWLLKGMRFAIAFGGIWMLGVVETSPILGTPLGDEVKGAVVDILPLFAMSLLLAWLFARNTGSVAPNKNGSWLSILVMALVFLAGRYLAYTVFDTMSGYAERPDLTFAWTAVMSLAVGLMYRLLGDGINSASVLRRAFRFSALVFGAFWVPFSFFIVVIYDWPVSDLVIRDGIDLAFVFAGVLIYERLAVARPQLANRTSMADEVGLEAA
jgi:hypothetical protein